MQKRNKKAMGDFSLNIPRTYDAPASKVFDAWINPVSVKTWLAEGGSVVSDPRVDGLYYIEMTTQSGVVVPHYGRYLTIDSPTLLEFTWVSEYTYGKESVVKIELSESAGKTQLTLTHDGLPDEKQVGNHRGGWTYFLDSLPNHLR